MRYGSVLCGLVKSVEFLTLQIGGHSVRIMSPENVTNADFACRLCGKKELYLYYCLGNQDEFKYYRCPVCGLVNYDLAAGLDQEQYTELIDPNDDSAKRNHDKDDTWRFIENYLPDAGSYLDIGSGSGRLLCLAKRAGWSVKGLELSPEMAKHASESTGVEVRAMNFLDCEPRPDDQYDLVSLRHVIEHLPDSQLAMRKIKALLKPGGYALLEFPNVNSLNKRLKRLTVGSGLYRRRFKKSFVPGHCNEFCRASFEYLLEQTGFSLVRWETYSSNPVTNLIYNVIHVGNKARALIRVSEEGISRAEFTEETVGS